MSDSADTGNSVRLSTLSSLLAELLSEPLRHLLSEIMLRSPMPFGLARILFYARKTRKIGPEDLLGRCELLFFSHGHLDFHLAIRATYLGFSSGEK